MYTKQVKIIDSIYNSRACTFMYGFLYRHAVGVWYTMWACILLLALYQATLPEDVVPMDYTDTGVGCIDDCLEPLY
mgnify:FL=1